MKKQYLHQTTRLINPIHIQKYELFNFNNYQPTQELINAIAYCEDVRSGKIKTKSYTSLKEILKEAGI